MFRRRIRMLTLLLGTVLVLLPLYGQDVQIDRDELADIGDNSIKFTNYVGPHEFTNTLDQIRSIGRRLGTRIDPASSSEVSESGKYRVIHIVNPDIEEGLDADVFILEDRAAVDHIVNLRNILAGYIESAYGFSSRDAYLLAEFITYYNAVYRGNLSVVQERYKAPVAEVLNPVKIGLDTHYLNWPGQTQMLIPLRGDVKVPKIDTEAISDEEVIEEMRREEDMGIDTREDMVELREKELDEEQAELDDRREKAERQDEELAQEMEELQEKEEEGLITPAEVERKEKLEEEKDALEEEEAAIEEEQKKIDERTESVMEMRDDIAEDKNVMMEDKESAEKPSETTPPTAARDKSAAPVRPVWFLTVDDDGDGIPYGRVVKYNLESGENLAVSDISAVRGRTLVLLPDTLLVIAGKTNGNGKVRPMLLDRGTLEVLREGNHDVFPGSLMTARGNSVYLITMESGEWRLGKFDTELERTAVSKVAVEPWTSVSFEGDSLFVQDSQGGILRLSISDLGEQDRLE